MSKIHFGGNSISLREGGVVYCFRASSVAQQLMCRIGSIASPHPKDIPTTVLVRLVLGKHKEREDLDCIDIERIIRLAKTELKRRGVTFPN